MSGQLYICTLLYTICILTISDANHVRNKSRVTVSAERNKDQRDDLEA